VRALVSLCLVCCPRPKVLYFFIRFSFSFSRVDDVIKMMEEDRLLAEQKLYGCDGLTTPRRMSTQHVIPLALSAEATNSANVADKYEIDSASANKVSDNVKDKSKVCSTCCLFVCLLLCVPHCTSRPTNAGLRPSVEFV
jgi:hypothetical protein